MCPLGLPFHLVLSVQLERADIVDARPIGVTVMVDATNMTGFKLDLRTDACYLYCL